MKGCPEIRQRRSILPCQADLPTAANYPAAIRLKEAASQRIPKVPATIIVWGELNRCVTLIPRSNSSTFSGPRQKVRCCASRPIPAGWPSFGEAGCRRHKKLRVDLRTESTSIPDSMYVLSFLCCAPSLKQAGPPRDSGDATPRQFLQRLADEFD